MTHLPRNQIFTHEREPFRHTSALQLNHAHGPFAFLNPTTAHFDLRPSAKSSNASQTPSEDEDTKHSEAPSPPDPDQKEVPADNVQFKWTSRNNRKGRHAIVVHPSSDGNAKYLVPTPTTEFTRIMHVIWLMFTYFPVWDVSWNVAFIFTLGSIIWCLNAFFSVFSILGPNFTGESLYAGGISAFIGATIFEVGSVLLMFEAVNENRSACFGWALEQLYDEHISHEGRAMTRLRASPEECIHHHANKSNFVGSSKEDNLATVRKKTGADDLDPTPPGAKSWVWWPSWSELRSYYFHDLGFLACSAQMFGATIFWISGFTALPGIYTGLTTTALLNGCYWVPQVIGGSGFVVSGALFMIETQSNWWKPAPKVLGWWIGGWNLIGGIGFTICPVFGLYNRGLQASIATTWGSWAFLIGSAIQWYESLDKHPVETANE